MTNVIKYPAARQHNSADSHYPSHPDKFLLLVEDEGDVHGFLELLELIYDTNLQINHKQGDLSRMWVSLPKQPHHTLAGVRVAARICEIEFDVVNRII